MQGVPFRNNEKFIIARFFNLKNISILRQLVTLICIYKATTAILLKTYTMSYFISKYA